MSPSALPDHTLLIAVLGMVSGMLWSITYLLVIRQGWSDRTFAMPVLAMTVNLSWEFIYTFIYHAGGALQARINIMWFLMDLGILFTYLKFWESYYPPHLPRALMLPRLLASLAGASVLIVAIAKQFGEGNGSGYSAFGDNLMMSVLFLALLTSRGNRRGQSLVIAWTKLLGTVAASLSQYIYDPTNAVWNMLYIEIFLLDLLYVFMLSRAPLYQGEPAAPAPA